MSVVANRRQSKAAGSGGQSLRREMDNSRSDNDQDQQDCENDPKLAHVALMISTQYRGAQTTPRKFCEKILDPKRSDKADGLQHLPSITVKAKVVGVGTDIARKRSSKHPDTGCDVNWKHVLRSDPVRIGNPADCDDDACPHQSISDQL